MYTTSLFTLSEKKQSFPSVYIIDKTCFDKYFMPCDNWKTLFFIQI